MYTYFHEGKEYKIGFRNDVVFKLTLGSNDDESRELLKFVVEAVTKKKYQELIVINTEQLGKFVLHKKNYLDIKSVDMNGRIANIEMQQSYLNEEEIKRLQQYAARSQATLFSNVKVIKN